MTETELNKALGLVKPSTPQEGLEDDIDTDDLVIGEPEDYEDYDQPDYGDEDELSEEDLESTTKGDDSESEEEEPEDLRTAFIKAQAELQRVKQERDKAVPKPKNVEEWVQANPNRGPLGEDGKATDAQREAYYTSRVLAAEMKVARMEAEREAGIAVTFLDLLSDAGVEMEWQDADRFVSVMTDVNGRISEILDALLQAEVNEKMKEVEKRWGVGKLHGSAKEPKRGDYENKRVKAAREAVSQERSAENVARFIRARAKAKQG